MMQDETGPDGRAAIERELLELAVRRYGPQTAGTLEHQIQETARALALIAEVSLETWSDEPDFLVAPQQPAP
jgi:hypothetical protein